MLIAGLRTNFWALHDKLSLPRPFMAVHLCGGRSAFMAIRLTGSGIRSCIDSSTADAPVRNAVPRPNTRLLCLQAEESARDAVSGPGSVGRAFDR